MTQEEKQLLLRDLCARIPYGVKVLNTAEGLNEISVLDSIFLGKEIFVGFHARENIMTGLISVKPYLRPMSSMTEEEKSEWLNGGLEVLKSVVRKRTNGIDNEPNAESHSFSIDWLNEHHFDYRGLIPMGLALEASEEMYQNL